MTDDKVVRFPTNAALPENPLTVEREVGWCAHPKIILDQHRRMVRCAACEKVIDPFDFLSEEVVRIQSAWDSHRAVKAMVTELSEKLGALKSEEKRLKSRIKTARDKVEPAVDFRTPRPL